ncbi:putative Ig domain-containing protein [Altererythrobacter sp. B11]|uniref:putative Ig domain-containing protein n=1 Tax=Altererythrobacter sp. B11 TaxID=2060312 RepID=UPI0011AE54E2|nr:putative Ig domain-containing protein [Altererythrobacter sp. B11]
MNETAPEQAQENAQANLAQAAKSGGQSAEQAVAAAGEGRAMPQQSARMVAQAEAPAKLSAKKARAHKIKKVDEEDAAQGGGQEEAAQADGAEQAGGAGGGGGGLSWQPALYILGGAAAIGGGILAFDGNGGDGEDVLGAPSLMLKTDTGSSASDFITQDGTINVSALAGTSSWEYSTNGGASWTAGAGSSFTLAEGSYAAGAVQVRQKDATGKVSEVGKIANAIVVDKTAAAAPVINAVAGDDVVNQGETQAPVTVSGTAEAGSSVKITWGATTKTVTAGADGSWSASFAPAELPADGDYSITASATDAAGNASATAARPVSIDSSNFISGHVYAGPVIAGIEVMAYKADGTLLGSAVTDATGAFTMAFKGYTGLVLFSAVDPTTNSQGYLDEATGTQADIDVMLRAVATVTAGQDVTINITPLTEVSTRLMSPELATQGTTNLGGVSSEAVANANATVATLFTDGDGALVDQMVKLVIDSAGADTSATANVYGVYLAALQGWAHRENLTLDQAIQQIVDAITSTAKGADTTLADLGQANGNYLAQVLVAGFSEIVLHNSALANAALPVTHLQELGMVDDQAGPAFAAPAASATVLENAAVGTLIHTAAASDTAGAVTYSLNWGSGPSTMASYDVEDFFSINPQTGVVSLVAPLDYETDHTWYLEVTAKDFWGNESVQQLTINVGNVNEAPVLDHPLVDQVAIADQPFSYAIPAGAFSDVDGDALTYSAQVVDAQGNVSALPNWLTVDAQTGQISSTSAQAMTDPITIRVTASDGSLSASDDFTLSIASAPVVTGITADTAIAAGSSAVTFTVTLSEGVNYSSNSLPEVVLRVVGNGEYFPLATFDAAATAQLNDPTKLVFTAQMPVTDSTEVRVAELHFAGVTGVNSGEEVSPASGQLVTYNALPFVLDSTPPVLTTSTFTANENATAVATLSASEAVTWMLAPGGDSGLFTLNSSGVLSFAAPRDYETQPHSYTINVMMEDVAGNQTTQGVTVNLANVNEAPVLAQALADQTTIQGQAFNYTVPSNSFSDVDGDTLTYTAQLVGSGGALSALPSWLTFDAATHSFTASSAPALASPLTVRVTASDGSLSVSDDFTVSQASVPTFSTNLTSITNLDVRSNLVFTGSENVHLTSVDGVYEISVSNDANTAAKAGYSGTIGETINNTQTLIVTVSGGVATATWNGSTVNLADVLTISGNKAIINPVYDLDFSNNYHVEIDAGLFVGDTSGLGNASYTSGAFATVTPGASLATAAASVMMNDSGTSVGSHNWVGIDGIGNTAVSAPTSLGSLGSSNIALVATDRQPGDGIGTWDFWARATNFGADDLVYLDNQQNGVPGWDLANTYFQSGDTFPDDTRVDFGTYNGEAPFPNSSQSFLDLDIDGAWRETPADVMSHFNSPTPLFVGG